MAKIFRNYRKESREQYGQHMELEKHLTRDQLNTGCLLRIADSLEKMQVPYEKLIIDLENSKLENLRLKKQLLTAKRSAASCRTRLSQLKKSQQSKTEL